MNKPLRFVVRLSNIAKDMGTYTKTLLVFLFPLLVSHSVESQDIQIKLVSPIPGMITTIQDSVIGVKFQVHPYANYGFEVFSYPTEGATLKAKEIRYEDGMYLCDVPLGLGKNVVKIFAWPSGRFNPDNLRMESLEVYYKLPNETAQELIVPSDIIPKEMVPKNPDTVIIVEYDTITEVITKYDTITKIVTKYDTINKIFTKYDTLTEVVVQYDTITKEMVKIDTLQETIVQYDTITKTIDQSDAVIAPPPQGPLLTLHRPHPLDDPNRGNQFTVHERQFEIRFSVAPYDSLDSYHCYIYESSDPKAAKQTRQKGDTFYEKIDLKKRENKMVISFENLTKGITLEKSFELLYEPQNFERRGKDYALFIAVEEYQPDWVKLQNPVNDIKAIGNLLKEQYGFETDYLFNPNGEEMEAAIRSLVKKKYQEHDQLLIFLSGHGVYDKLFENGYFAPVDANPMEQTRRSYYSYKELKDQITKLGCKKILLMIDACYSGAFFDLPPLVPKSGPDGSLPTAKEKRIYLEMLKSTYKALTSADRQTATYDNWYGLNHSPFTDQILKTLKTKDPDGIVDLNDLDRGMENLGSIGQTPVLHSFAPLLESPGADFYFIQK